jgi:hypothetical protein
VDLGLFFLFLLFFCSGVSLYMIFFFCLAWYLCKKAQERAINLFPFLFTIGR